MSQLHAHFQEVVFGCRPNEVQNHWVTVAASDEWSCAPSTGHPFEMGG